MDLFSFSGLAASVLALIVIFILSLRYLSLLRWVGTGQAYVLSKKQERFTVLEVLELLKNAKPFPVSYQKGWKIHSFIHGHRVWFHFLTFTRAGGSSSATSASGSQNNIAAGTNSAPCIKVFATFDRVRASAQVLLQLVKDTSLSCEWKPGVIAARSVHEVPASEANGRNRAQGSLPVLDDFVRVERVKSVKYQWPWINYGSADNVTPTVIEDYKRYWHREDNGCSWLLQMNEEAQSFVFFLIQPVEDPDHCLVTVITWSASHTDSFIPVDETPSVLLSSLSDYIHLRRVQMTPLMQISLPHRIIKDGKEAGEGGAGSASNSVGSSASGFMSRVRNFIDQSSYSRSSPPRSVVPEAIRKSASILRFKSNAMATSAGSAIQTNTIHEEDDESDSEKGKGEGVDSEHSSGGVEDVLDAARLDGAGEARQSPLRRAISEGGQRITASPSLPEILPPLSEEEEKAIARYRTQVNQAAADIMAEALRASNIDLETTPADQAAASSGWTYLSFESNIVVLKKTPPRGSTVQSYIGKGFILAPPKTVWDAIRNPRTRFTYDETLKKVDILEQVTQGLKIVYLYQEILGLLHRECCDLCVLQGERVEGNKYVLAYTSIEHPKAPVSEGVLRGKMLSSGWIVEPVRKDKKLYSLVTYIMQLDYGPARASSDHLPFEDMTCRQPLSISYLQQYLKPAVLLARRKSDSFIPVQ